MLPPSGHRPAPDCATLHAPRASLLDDPAVIAGADVGATLVKLAIREPGGATALETRPVRALDAVAERLASAGARHAGLTGGGAPALETRLRAQLDGAEISRHDELSAWAVGARRMLRGRGVDLSRFLLVSVGTGTSAMLVNGSEVTRLGGTALGGGTLMGLGSVLTGSRDFDVLVETAAEGDRRNVDLLVSDVYPKGDFLLPGAFNAASFAKVMRLPEGERAHPADLADGVMGLVGENVALICCGLAAAHDVERMVWGGTTLRNNPSLVQVLAGVCRTRGHDPLFLPKGEFVGALGALECADPLADEPDRPD